MIIWRMETLTMFYATWINNIMKLNFGILFQCSINVTYSSGAQRSFYYTLDFANEEIEHFCLWMMFVWNNPYSVQITYWHIDIRHEIWGTDWLHILCFSSKLLFPWIGYFFLLYFHFPFFPSVRMLPTWMIFLTPA